MKKRNFWILTLLIILIPAAAGVVWFKFEWEKPALLLLPESGYVGQKLSLRAEDRKSGLAEIRLEAIQQGKTVLLLTEKYPRGTFRVEKTFSFKPLPQGLRDGEVRFRLLARDHSWIKGNPVSLEKTMVLDTQPPRLAVLGSFHYVNQGGAGLITYEVSKETPISGVKVGDVFFPGYRAGKNRYLAFFALPYDAPRDASFSVTAEDRAGNRAAAPFRPIIKAKRFLTDRIQITDGFVNKILPYFREQNPQLQGTPQEMFLSINRKQRAEDEKKIKELCRQSADQVLWSGPFLRLPNSKPMASFAQTRTYLYDGKEIDRQVHLGADLAALAQSPVPSANAGRVVYAGPLGIYGNSVLVDHGCGLFSMYSHLSRIETEVKKEVKKGDLLGRTGFTGLAGGDHLHFGMLIAGVFVNPIEWWDGHWIKDNIELKMREP